MSPVDRSDDPTVWVVIVNYDGLSDTIACLSSLMCQTRMPSIVVVDNASRDDPTAQLADEFRTVHVVRSKTNGGWAGGNNLGIRYALERNAAFIVCLNNDTVVAPNLIERLRAAADEHPRFGILGPVICDLEPPSAVQTEGTNFNRNSRPEFFQRVAAVGDSVRHDSVHHDASTRVVECDVVNGCCLMLRREVVERIGLIDEKFFLIHEESDFCLRAQEVGFRIGVLGEPLVRHKGSTTFRREGSRHQRYYDARNLVPLIRKHSRAPRRRGLMSSLARHLRYVFHRYSLEREAERPDGAEAVLEGFCDGHLRRFGPWKKRRRPELFVVRAAFSALWRLKRIGRLRRERLRPAREGLSDTHLDARRPTA